MQDLPCSTRRLARKASPAMHLCLAATTFLGFLGFFGCEKEPKEAAPITAGDYLKYVFTIGGSQGGSQYRATIRMTPEGTNAIRLHSAPEHGEASIVVNKALSASKMVRMHSFGMLWLPTEQRHLDAPTDVGTVQRERAFQQYSTFVIPQPGQSTNERFYDQETGFLVGYIANTPSGPTNCTLEESSIAGL